MKKEKEPPIPAEHPDSVRKQIISLLQEDTCSARDLSAAVRIPEKEVYEHLDHIKKSSGHLNLRFAIIPATCQKCGYSFAKREKLKKPGKCPACSSEWIEAPRFAINK
ncbi:MAG: transcriptional regulator [Desulfurivibrionaceae bacterium]